MAGGGKRKLARGRTVEKPGFEHAVVDDGERVAQNTFAVERARAQSAPPKRIVDDADTRAEQAFTHAVFQEARLACDRGAVDRGGEVPHQRARDAGLEHDGYTSRLDLAWVHAPDCALAGDAPHLF